ncbi:MAG TPA: hypothetical protein VFJ52_05860, partial [Terriglobia bacterium]|nr:hypothetical protein [Terriglobia bacterium]
EGSPRAAQLRFLTSLERLLKPNGVMVIGIENRFGISSLRGAVDHSGMPYTSLVPRRVATLMLRHGKDAHPIHRTRLESRQYRTYTYTAGGYRRLLKAAGFATVRAYWAHEGYNNPFRLIPLDARPLVREQFQFLIGNFGTLAFVPRSLRLKARWGRSRPFGWLVSQFVLVAGKDDLRQTKVDTWFDEARKGLNLPVNFSGTHQAYRAVYTNPKADKLVVKFWDAKAGCIPAVAKINLRKPSKLRDDVEAEYTTLVRVEEQLRQSPGACVRVPRPLGMMKSGSHCYTLESLAAGKRFREITFREGYATNQERALKGFRRVVKAGAELTRALQGLTGIRAVGPGFYSLPKEIAAENSFADRVGRMRYFSDSGPGAAVSWIQHGDFWPGNIYVCER